MVNLSQAEFTRLARGDIITPGIEPPTEYFILGIRSSAGGCVRRVHSESVEMARSRFASVNGHYLFGGGAAAAAARAYRQCLERYISLDGTGAEAVDLPSKGVPVAFEPGNIVRSRPDVVLGPNEDGLYEVRVLLWDELALDRASAEVIALPALEYVRSTQGADAIVRIWQLATQQEEIVSPDEADGRRGDVEALLLGLDAGT
jgi:hypothetical protein